VDICKVVEEGVKLALSTNDKTDVIIKKNVPAGLQVTGDESKLKRSVMNLVKNGIEALTDNKVSHPEISIAAALDPGKNG